MKVARLVMLGIAFAGSGAAYPSGSIAHALRTAAEPLQDAKPINPNRSGPMAAISPTGATILAAKSKESGT